MGMEETALKAVLYARVSSKEQEREGFSIPAQLELLRAYANTHGFEITQEYTEAETAKKAGRTQWNAMMEAVLSKSGPKVVLVEKVDRLLRNFTDFVRIEAASKTGGVAFHLVKEHEVLDSSAGSNSWFMFTIKASVAKWYSDNLSEESKKGMRQRAMAGLHHGVPPIGYRGLSGQVVTPCPDRAPMVQRAFALYSTGNYSLDETRRTLKREGFPLWSKSQTERVLKNPFYKGKVQHQGVLYDGQHEPIISADQWSATQWAFKRDGKPNSVRKHVMRYQGIMKCGVCGGSVTGDIKKEGRYTYWRCCNAMGSKESRLCDQPAVNQGVIDEQIDRLLGSLTIQPEYKTAITTAMLEMEGMREEETQRAIAQLNRDLTKTRNTMKQAYRDKLSGLVDAETYAEVSQEHKWKIEELERHLSNIGHVEESYYDIVVNLLELPETLITGWSQADEERRRELMGILVSNCTLLNKKLTYERNPAVALMLNMGKTEEWRSRLDEFRIKLSLHSRAIRGLLALAA